MRKFSTRQYAEAYLDIMQSLPVKERVGFADRFIQILARQRALRLVPRIAKAVEELIAERGGPIVVTVRCPKTVETDVDQNLATNLEAALKRKVKVRHIHQPNLLAGIKIQVGDRLIDNTLSTRLVELRKHFATT
jgi:F-type H+-transporting ATPase subunit delta